MAGAGEDSRGEGEVERHRGASQPGRVRGEHPGGQVREWAVLQLGDDLFDDGVIAVGGLGGQHRLGRVGEHGVIAVDGEASVCPAGTCVGLRRRTRRTISRAVR